MTPPAKRSKPAINAAATGTARLTLIDFWCSTNAEHFYRILWNSVFVSSISSSISVSNQSRLEAPVDLLKRDDIFKGHSKFISLDNDFNVSSNFLCLREKNNCMLEKLKEIQN